MTRARLSFDAWPAAVYAVGDVHGHLPQLQALERQIFADGKRLAGEKWIVMLGDHVDRGPASAGVIAHLLGPVPDGWRRFCLAGNHELMMLDFLADPDTHGFWLQEGGLETLASYAGSPAADGGSDVAIPRAHLAFLATLPLYLRLPGWLFVHAGLRPRVPLEAQTEDDLTGIRQPFLDDPDPAPFRVVHGHTPAREPVVTPTRIGIDTHCYHTGRLSAVRVLPDGGTRFFSATG